MFPVSKTKLFPIATLLNENESILSGTCKHGMAIPAHNKRATRHVQKPMSCSKYSKSQLFKIFFTQCLAINNCGKIEKTEKLEGTN